MILSAIRAAAVMVSLLSWRQKIGRDSVGHKGSDRDDISSYRVASRSAVILLAIRAAAVMIPLLTVAPEDRP